MEPPVVTILDGQLKGCIMNDYNEDNIFAFLGIPYAKPAVGNLRFKPPEPIDSWTGVKDATKNGDKCVQKCGYSNVVLEGSEDCLHVNVFTKELYSQNTGQLKPVMVWIHGGGFYYGSNRTESFGPGYLLTEDIVLVTVNYRLGVFGFLKVEDPSLKIYGNAGLKDQRLALKWVQNNIHVFGGDSNNVTLFGESAGAASVHYHMLSQSSKGLFHKAILQSGVSFNKWATDPAVTVSLVKLLTFIGKDAKTEKEALNILKTIPAQELYAAQEKYMASTINTGLIFVPVYEEPNNAAIIVEEPLDLLTTGQYHKIPMVLGYNSNEGLYFEIDKRMKESNGIKVINRYSQTEKFLPRKIQERASSEIVQQLCQKLLKVYDNDKSNLMKLSDAHFTEPIIAAVKIHANISCDPPIYLYRMDIDDDLNIMKKMGNFKDLPGMCHADELGYIFTVDSLPKVKKGSSAEVAMRRTVKLWTNFAKYSNPTPSENELNVIWKPVTQETINFLEIGSDLRIKTNPDPERMKLWEEIRQVAANY